MHATVQTVLLSLLICLLLFVTRDGGLIYSFQPHLYRATKSLRAITRKFSSSVEGRLRVRNVKDGNHNNVIKNDPEIMVSSSSLPSTSSTPDSAIASSSSSTSTIFEDTNYSYDADVTHKYIFPLILNGNDISANTGSGLVNVLQGVDNEEGVEMTYSMHKGGGVFVNYHFPEANSQHDIRIGKFPLTSKLTCTSRIKRWWMVGTLIREFYCVFLILN